MCEHGNDIGEIKGIVGGIKEDVTEIKTQVKATNGKVRSLEIWRSFILGGLAILGILVVPVLIWALTSLLGIGNIDTKVQSALQYELSKYEVIIE